MTRQIGIREMDEWIYGLSKAVEELDPDLLSEPVKIIHGVIDHMREERARLLLLRRNEAGY